MSGRLPRHYAGRYGPFGWFCCFGFLVLFSARPERCSYFDAAPSVAPSAACAAASRAIGKRNGDALT